jgi:hypothetical protein
MLRLAGSGTSSREIVVVLGIARSTPITEGLPIFASTSQGGPTRSLPSDVTSGGFSFSPGPRLKRFWTVRIEAHGWNAAITLFYCWPRERGGGALRGHRSRPRRGNVRPRWIGAIHRKRPQRARYATHKGRIASPSLLGSRSVGNEAQRPSFRTCTAARSACRRC